MFLEALVQARIKLVTSIYGNDTRKIRFYIISGPALPIEHM